MMKLGSSGRAPLALATILAAEILSPTAARAEPAPAPAPRPAQPSARSPAPSAAPIEASLVIASPALVEAMAARLAGHRFTRGDGALVLDDIAGDGRPWVGVVSSRCGALWLDTALRSLRLTGPLARPRLAGPGYLMWAIGDLTAAANANATGAPGERLELRRLGVLARPAEVPRDRPPPAAGIAPCPPP